MLDFTDIPEEIKNMEETAFEVAVQYTNAEELIEAKEFYEKEGSVDMCKALKELIEDGREEGIELAKKVYKFHIEGKSDEDIAKLCDISVMRVRKILE